jgi:AcrR family transcriptional regulator
MKRLVRKPAQRQNESSWRGASRAKAAARHPASVRAPARRPRTLPPRAREFLAAALDLFSAREFTEVTIKDIAEIVGVNAALIYYYFDDKEDLFRASLEHAVNRALNHYKDLAKLHTDPIELIEAWFATHIELVVPIRQMVKVLMDYSLARVHQRVIDSIIARFYDEESRILTGAIRRGIEHGSFESVAPNDVALFISTHLDGVMVRSLIQKQLDVAAAINGLQGVLWQLLGYRGNAQGARA